jgi:hypothetical protein
VTEDFLPAQRRSNGFLDREERRGGHHGRERFEIGQVPVPKETREFVPFIPRSDTERIRRGRAAGWAPAVA